MKLEVLEVLKHEPSRDILIEDALRPLNEQKFPHELHDAVYEYESEILLK